MLRFLYMYGRLSLISLDPLRDRESRWFRLCLTFPVNEYRLWYTAVSLTLCSRLRLWWFRTLFGETIQRWYMVV